MEPRAGVWTRRRARAAESSSASQGSTQPPSSAPLPTEKEKAATQSSAASAVSSSQSLEKSNDSAPPGKKTRTSEGEGASDHTPSSPHSSMHGEEGSVASSMDGTESMSSVQHSRLTLNPVPGRIAAKLISQEQEDEFNKRSTAHDDHLVPEGFVSVAQSSAVFDKFEEEIGAAEGPLCIGVLYRFDMTNFRKGELMGNYFQRPSLLDVILGVAILGAKHKGKPYYLPLYDDVTWRAEATTGIPKRRKWHLFLSLLGAEREGESRKKLMVREEEKIVFGAQELLKHVIRHNPDAYPRYIFDPAIAAWMLDSELPSFEFPALLQHFLPSLAVQEEKDKGMQAPYATQPKDKRANARMLFKDMCLQLAALLRPRLESAEVTASLQEIEMPLVPLLAKMENTGVLVDVELLKNQQKLLREHLAYLRRESRNIVGEEVDLASPQKLSDLLFNQLRMRPPIESSSPRPSVSEAVLKQLSLTTQHAILPIIVDFRHTQKLLSAYVDALISKTVAANGHSCVYPIWHHTGTSTGRLSASEPAIQNLPRVPYALKRPDFFGPGGETKINIRDAIIARPQCVAHWVLDYLAISHVFIAADYMQLEARVLAHFSQDPFLLSFLSSGGDLHRLVAARMRGKAEEEITEEERDTAKHIVYGILYGIGPTSLSELLQVTPEIAKAYIEEFLSRFPLVRAFLGSAVAEAKENSAVRTAFGRRRLLPNISSQNPAESNKAERQAVNSKVQGTAADIAKAAMLRVNEALRHELKHEAKLVMQIHDELVYEVPEPGLAACAAIIRQKMETSLSGVALPVRVYYGPRFGSLRPWRGEERPTEKHTTVSAGGSIV